jgi:hypothetical protein
MLKYNGSHQAILLAFQIWICTCDYDFDLFLTAFGLVNFGLPSENCTWFENYEVSSMQNQKTKVKVKTKIKNKNSCLVMFVQTKF